MTVTIKSVATNGRITDYLGTQPGLIEAGIVPPDFFNFRGPTRKCSREWYGKRKPTVYAYPDGVDQIWVKKKGKLWLASISHAPDSPPFVPPGETWQRSEPEPEPSPEATQAYMRYAYRFHTLNDTLSAAPYIGTGCRAQRDNTFTVVFSGTREQLINSGVATAAMFPEGTTPTGRVRRDKRSGKRSPMPWYVNQDGDRWHVCFYDVSEG